MGYDALGGHSRQREEYKQGHGAVEAQGIVIWSDARVCVCLRLEREKGSGKGNQGWVVMSFHH